MSTAPLLLYFVGLRSWLRLHQASMARKAAAGAETVAALGQRMRRTLVRSNANLSGAMAATAAATFRDGALPRWLGWLSCAAAVAHAAPVATRRLENLPYPFFVAWLVAVTAVLARRPGPLD